MARIMEPTPDQERAWAEWVESRPDPVRAVARRFEPWSLYRLKSSGYRVTLLSFGEGDDGAVTLRVHVSGDYNAIAFERQVFGIHPDDLEPCEPPGPDEVVGAILTGDADIKAYVESLRGDAPGE